MMTSAAYRLSLALATLQLLAACQGGDAHHSGTLIKPEERDGSASGGAGSEDTEPQTRPVVNIPGSNNPSAINDKDPMDRPLVGPCVPAKSTEPVPARTIAMSEGAQPSKRRVYSADLFESFDNLCGSCHVVQALGSFRIRDYIHLKADTADEALQRSLIDSMETNEKATVMPPFDQTGKLGTDRKPGDPVLELDTWFKAYFDAGSPIDWFELDAEKRSDPPTTSYTLNEDVGTQLTNIGSCMPPKEIMRANSSTMDRLDMMFAQMKTFADLPKYLDQTDLTTFDSEALAKDGVVSFAPAYPLFSDNARKMRHVRVPRGRSIAFDPKQQAFDIPENTRFYKTFFKKVIERDDNGDTSERYRKIETRIILARKDGDDSADGSHTTNALFGTYAWDENETTAVLVTDPLRNGEPFRDRLVTYITDEGKAADALAATEISDRLQALLDTKATRTWAIPGSERCIQCHMGSANRDFVLGFLPVQISRRKTDEGGTYEATSDDELTQLQRLIDLGVLTGIKSSADVLPIESPQADRAPRNEYEVKAQAYMLGNCSHCHNPRGYPSVQNPVLRPLLNFLPQGTEGGIYQFPLERTSPRIKRGFDQTVEIPYITPSLLDKDQDFALTTTDNPGGAWQKRWAGGAEVQNLEPSTTHYMAAPWRSLIYRNVESPYLYAEDFALYPHMPRNVAGFDTRVPRIMADWMVSIPAQLKPSPDATVFERKMAGQPYVEVKPSDAGYATAQAEATKRLDLYHKGGRSNYDYFTKDFPGNKFTVFDSVRYEKYNPDDTDTILHSPPPAPGQTAKTVYVPEDVGGLPTLIDELKADNGQPEQDLLHYWGLSPDKVPDKPNWVRTDTTDAPGNWYPRRSDWEDVIVAPTTAQVTVLNKKYPSPGLCKNPSSIGPENDTCLQVCDAESAPGSKCSPGDNDVVARQKFALSELRFKTLTDAFKTFALTPRPFTAWRAKPNCTFPNVKHVSDFAAGDAWRWMTSARMPLDPNTPVYMESIGGGVFKEICINCHGKALDSHGIQADSLSELTGGKSRVANFRDGLLGPRADPGSYRKAVFDKRAHMGLTGEDWAARYVAWMALGGTQSQIDTTILGLIANAPVMGVKRTRPVPIADANMLAVAQALCRETIGNPGSGDVYIEAATGYLSEKPADRSLIETLGDGELWRRLCAFQNTRPIFVAKMVQEGKPLLKFDSLRDPQAYPYPADAELADHEKSVVGYSNENQGPWCVITAATDEEKQVEGELLLMRADRKLPKCPADWLQSSKPMDASDIERWTARGAINAGFAVFAYVDQVSKNLATGADGKMKQDPAPNFDECEQLEAKK